MHWVSGLVTDVEVFINFRGQSPWVGVYQMSFMGHQIKTWRDETEIKWITRAARELLSTMSVSQAPGSSLYYTLLFISNDMPCTESQYSHHYLG